MRKPLTYPLIRCVGCEGVTLSPRRLCPTCELHHAMAKATIKGRCSHCGELTVLTEHNLCQGDDGRYALICEDCEERG